MVEKPRVTKLSGSDATEQALREWAPRSRYIHLATHGFFSRRPSIEKNDPRNASASDAKRGEASQGTEKSSRRPPAAFLFASNQSMAWHPGLFSGIVLSGANQAPSLDRDDGILTALELSGIDLESTELLALSACDTGLGSASAGEGLLGLQRSAHVAGARSVLASLWQVNDRDAQALMTRFYENLWKKKLSRLDALREAQLAMLRGELEDSESGSAGESRGPGSLRKKDSHSRKGLRVHPRAWAAWQLSGDWR